jgi:branched-chain amino acid transport system substrate-binding protein
MSKGINRRTFLKSSAVGGLGLIAGTGGMGLMRPRVVRAEEPVRFLLGTSFSGAYAESGLYTSRGIQLAVKTFGGSVLGRPIEVIERDTPNPAEGVRKAQEAVEKLGIKFLTVSPSSSTVLAVAEYAAKKGVVLLGHAGSDKITGSACNKSTFRWQVPTWGAVREVVPRIIDEYGAESFYTITPKYVFGEDLLRNTKEVLEQRGKKHIGNSDHPLGETEYSSYITKAMAAKADCVFLLNFGGDTVNCLKQAVNFGLQKVSRIACAWGSGITQMKAIGAKAMKDVLWGLQYFYKIDTPQNKAFVAAFSKEYGEVPPYIAASAYAGMITMLECIEKAGTDDPKKVIEAWEDYEYDGITGREKWRACNHQLIKNYFSVKCKGPDEMQDPEDFGDIIGYSQNFLPCEETGCKM